jgi:DNA polymerase IV
MRMVCLLIPHFYVQVKRLCYPDLRHSPIIIGGMPEERTPVVDFSEEAAKRGICPSMSMKEAYHLCPEAVLLPLEEDEYQPLWEEVISMLASFTLRIESEKPGIAYLDITRVPKIYASESLLASGILHEIASRFQLKATAGIGNSRFVARMAATPADRSPCIVPPGEEKRFLSTLPMEELPIEENVKGRLRLLGLHTVKKVAALPLNALAAQLGSAGIPLWETANGIEEEGRIPPKYLLRHLEREVLCDVPLEVMEHLKPLLEETIRELHAELEGIGKICRKIKLVFYLLDGPPLEKYFILHTPTACAEEIMRRIWRGMEFLVLEGPVTGFAVHTLALAPRERVQETLFRARQARSISGLNNIKGYLKAKYGRMPVVRVEECDRDARLPERRFVFVEV